jgi:type IV fimbrial biogenesis protein FimT
MRRDLTAQVRGSIRRGFTLIELMVVVALVAVILALAGPSMKDMLELRRLKGVQAQVVTDMQFARSEAISKRSLVRVVFREDPDLPVTCYSIFLAETGALRCDCTKAPAPACTDPKTTEIRTVQVQRSTGVTVIPPAINDSLAFAFEPTNGALLTIPTDNKNKPLPAFAIDSSISTSKTYRTVLNQAGRPTVCAPAGSDVPEVRCP